MFACIMSLSTTSIISTFRKSLAVYLMFVKLIIDTIVLNVEFVMIVSECGETFRIQLRVLLYNKIKMYEIICTLKSVQ